MVNGTSDALISYIATILCENCHFALAYAILHASRAQRGLQAQPWGHSSHTAPTALPIRRQPRRFRPAPTNGPRTAVTFHEPLAQSVIQSDRWLPKVTRRPIDIKFHWSSIVVRHEQIIMMYVVAIQLYFCITCVPALIL